MVHIKCLNLKMFQKVVNMNLLKYMKKRTVWRMRVKHREKSGYLSQNFSKGITKTEEDGKHYRNNKIGHF